jgi:outer membrane receptor protein involved in Fe transport
VSAGQIESLLNGEIDERRVLPAAGLVYRPIEGLTLRGAYSQTTARPSFRELGFYVSVEPGSDDLIVGNPQLGLSDVESFDARAEYFWGDLGDMVAASGFYKTIDDPIESIILRNPLNAEESSSALWRTFLNNPSQAKLWGVEFEARKNLGFAGPDFLDYLSLGGNFTYIDAEVDRNPIEIARAEPFFGVVGGDREVFSQLASSRRLFGQPEWIVNADLSFEHPTWGTKATVAFFAISDVLDAAGSAFLGGAKSITIDRYVDSFYTLDLILSQRIPLERLRGEINVKFTAKNLTNSTRQLIYDPSQTDSTFTERSFKVGRDFKLSLTYTFF